MMEGRACNLLLRILSALVMTIIVSVPVCTQEKLSIRDWFEKRKESLTSGSGMLAENTFKPSWIRELEFRTETEDFLIDKQEYLVRYRPNFPGEKRAQSNLIKVSREEWNINQLNFENDLNRYLLDELLVIRNIYEELMLLNELYLVYQDQRKLISDQIYSGKFNFKDLSQINGDLKTIESKIADHQLRMDMLRQREILPDTDQLFEVQDLFQQLETRDLAQQSSLNITERDYELRKLDAEMELEKIESGRIFDFVQLRYNGPHNDLLSERLSLGVSIQFPNDSRKKLRAEELKVEQLIRQQELDHEVKLDSLKLSRDIEEFTLLIGKWNNRKEGINLQSEDLRSLINEGVNVEIDKPEVILFQKEQLLKMKLDQLDLEEDIYRMYLDLLERTSILGENRFFSFIISN